MHTTENPEEEEDDDEELEKLPSDFFFSLRGSGSDLRRGFAVPDWEAKGSPRREEHAVAGGGGEGGVVSELIARDDGAAIFAGGVGRR